MFQETKDVKNNFREKSDSEESWKPSRSDEESKGEPEPSKKRKSEENIDGRPKKGKLREENGGKEEKDVEKHVGEGSNSEVATVSTKARRKLACPLRSYAGQTSFICLVICGMFISGRRKRQQRYFSSTTLEKDRKINQRSRTTTVVIAVQSVNATPLSFVCLSICERYTT